MQNIFFKCSRKKTDSAFAFSTKSKLVYKRNPPGQHDGWSFFLKRSHCCSSHQNQPVTVATKQLILPQRDPRKLGHHERTPPMFVSVRNLHCTNLRRSELLLSCILEHTKILGLAQYTGFLYFAITLVSLLATATNQLFYSTYKATTFPKIYSG